MPGEILRRPQARLDLIDIIFPRILAAIHMGNGLLLLDYRTRDKRILSGVAQSQKEETYVRKDSRLHSVFRLRDGFRLFG